MRIRGKVASPLSPTGNICRRGVEDRLQKILQFESICRDQPLRRWLFAARSDLSARAETR
jgi:hypothetical protein